MKNLILIISIFFGSFASIAQFPSTPAKIVNKTSCHMYVILFMSDASCILTNSTTYAIPPHTVFTSPAPSPGSWYEYAFIADTPTANPSCYYQKVDVPWASCTTLSSQETGASCCGPMITSTWIIGGSNPSEPSLYILE